MLFHQAHLDPVPTRSHHGDAPRPPQSLTPLPHQMYCPSSLKRLTSLPSHLVYLVPCGQMPRLPTVPGAPVLGPSTQQVLSTGLQPQRKHTHSPSQGCFSGGGQLQLFSIHVKPNLVYRGLNHSPVCVSVCARRALSSSYPDPGLVPGDEAVT